MRTGDTHISRNHQIAAFNQQIQLILGKQQWYKMVLKTGITKQKIRMLSSYMAWSFGMMFLDDLSHIV